MTPNTEEARSEGGIGEGCSGERGGLIGDVFDWRMPNGEQWRKGQDRSDARGGGDGRGRARESESESARRERRMESTRGCVHLTNGGERVHTPQSRIFAFSAQDV